MSRPSARERLLDAADELFYAGGVHTVGIDRVIEHAGVAKASLYSTFGSKDELIRAYLDRRHARRRELLLAHLERYPTARERILGVFDFLAANAARPDARGCAFINAGAEAPNDSAILVATDDYRTWVRALFTDLARAAGAADPDTLAAQLVLLYDGSAVSTRMDRGRAGRREGRRRLRGAGQRCVEALAATPLRPRCTAAWNFDRFSSSVSSVPSA